MYKLWETMHKLRENKVVRYCIIPILIIAAMCFVFLYGMSWIPVQEIDFTKKITTIKSDEVYVKNPKNIQYSTNDTVTVKGIVYNPWFSDGFFVGNVDFENNSDFSRELTLSTSNVKVGSILYDPADGYMYDTPQPTYIVEYIKELDEAITLRIRFNINDDNCENLYVGIDHKEGIILAKEDGI